MKIKAVIFDKDGVLFDSEIINVLSATYAFKNFGITLSGKDKKNIFGRHPSDYLKSFPQYNLPEEEFRDINRKKYYSLLKSVKLNKGILTLIKNLKKNKIKLALTTTSPKKITFETIRKFNLINFFNIVVTFEDIKARKPSPEPYLATIKKLNLSAKECIVIEDSPVGVESAKRAGAFCIALKTPYVTRKELKKADFIAKSSRDIEKYLEKLGVCLK